MLINSHIGLGSWATPHQKAHIFLITKQWNKCLCPALCTLSSMNALAVIFTWDVAIPLSNITKKAERPNSLPLKWILHGIIYSQYNLFSLNLLWLLSGNYMWIFSSFTERRVSHSLTHAPESGPQYCPQRSWCLQKVTEGVRAWSWTAGNAEPPS